MKEMSLHSSGGWIKRFVLIGFASVFALYLAGATAGYIWVRHVRKNDTVGFLDVALLRWKEVRRGMAAQQFAKAKSEWEAKNFQAAFLAYTFAVNNDPDNIPGRLAAAEFLVAAGSTTTALTMLEAGLARAPDQRKLIERTFDLLLGTGRDQRALELLHGRPASVFSDPNGPLLHRYEVQAALNLGDASGARTLLEKYSELEKNPASLPVVARVLWETKERLKAIDLLSRHVATGPETVAPYAQLVDWQLSVKMTDDAMRTAGQAVKKFREDPAARLLLIEALAAHTQLGGEWLGSIEAYLKDFGSNPQSIPQLAALAGRKGWVELARSLYELAATREPDVGMFGFFFADALMRQSRFRDARDVLAQLEPQAADSSSLFTVQLRHRQVIVAAALGDSANVREFSRRLASALRNDPAGLETSRRHFEKSGLKEAVAELVGGKPSGAVVATRK